MSTENYIFASDKELYVPRIRGGKGDCECFNTGSFLYYITQKEYKDITGTNPGIFKGDKFPVENVSWYDAVEFCNRMSEKYRLKTYYKIDKTSKDPDNRNSGDRLKYTVTILGGNGFRLPTEAEWEYACRGGTMTAFCYGNSLDSSMANFDGNFPYNSSRGISREMTMTAGSFKPNAWGLYDMHGNVWEWCFDWYAADYNSTGTAKGAVSGEYRVLRGGSWYNYGTDLRSALRYMGWADARDSIIGFRVCRSVN